MNLLGKTGGRPANLYTSVEIMDLAAAKNGIVSSSTKRRLHTTLTRQKQEQQHEYNLTAHGDGLYILHYDVESRM